MEQETLGGRSRVFRVAEPLAFISLRIARDLNELHFFEGQTFGGVGSFSGFVRPT
jgi:hypothetical protein